MKIFTKHSLSVEQISIDIKSVHEPEELSNIDISCDLVVQNSITKYDNGKLKFNISGGTDGINYPINITLTTNYNDIYIIDDIYISIDDSIQTDTILKKPYESLLYYIDLSKTNYKYPNINLLTQDNDLVGTYNIIGEDNLLTVSFVTMPSVDNVKDVELIIGGGTSLSQYKVQLFLVPKNIDIDSINYFKIVYTIIVNIE